MIGNVYGIEGSNKNFVSVIYNQSTGKYDISYNVYIKSPLARAYDIDPGYDFGSIKPLDIVVDLYIKGLDSEPGVTLRKQV